MEWACKIITFNIFHFIPIMKIHLVFNFFFKVICILYITEIYNWKNGQVNEKLVGKLSPINQNISVKS